MWSVVTVCRACACVAGQLGPDSAVTFGTAYAGAMGKSTGATAASAKAGKKQKEDVSEEAAVPASPPPGARSRMPDLPLALALELTEDPGEGLHVEPLQGLGAHQQQRGGAVVQRAGVGGCDRA